MKLMSYNIFDGAVYSLDKVTEIVNSESPDYLTINEANTFAKNDNEILKKFANKTGFESYELAACGEGEWHVAAFSKYPFKKIEKLQPLKRACIMGIIDSPLGEISVASLHLSPFSEDTRHPEIDLILGYQREYKNRILMGDMNSLSEKDNYDPGMAGSMNQIQAKKYTTNGSLRFDAISKIESAGYVDVAEKLGKNKENTVPTPANKDYAHSNLRLDYIFISESLVANIRDYYVVKNSLTDLASDHYPVVAVLD